MKIKILLVSLLLLLPVTGFAESTLKIKSVKVNGESNYAVVKPSKFTSVEVVLKSPIRYSQSLLSVSYFPSDKGATVYPVWFKSNLSTTTLNIQAPKEEGIFDVVVKVYEDGNRNELLDTWTGTDMLGVQTAPYVKPEILATSTSRKVEPSIEDLQAQVAYLIRVVAQLISQLQSH